MNANVVISEVDSIMRVVLSKAEKKTRVLWRISCYQNIYNAVAEMPHKPRSLRQSSIVVCHKREIFIAVMTIKIRQI